MISCLLKIALPERKAPGFCSLTQIRDLWIQQGSLFRGTHIMAEVNVFIAIFTLQSAFTCGLQLTPRKSIGDHVFTTTVITSSHLPHIREYFEKHMQNETERLVHFGATFF